MNRKARKRRYLSLFTLVLRYENRALKQAVTRGVEGLVGEDVTHTARMMLNVPLTIPYTGPLEV